MATKNNSEHFIELANKRVPKALKYLDLIGNLANKSNYSYTEQQSHQIKKALKDMKIAKNLKNKEITKTIFVKDKIVNLVIK